MYFDPVEAGKRVKKLRESQGYTQEQFSEKIHVSRNYLSKLEIGLRQPSIDLWIEIGVVTGATLDHLILGSPMPTDKEQVKSDLQSMIDRLTQLKEEIE